MRQPRAAEITPPEPPAANHQGGVIVTTAEQMALIVREAVAEALEALGPAVGNRKLLNRVELARALTCSPTQVDKLRRAGLPHLRVGDSPRFDIDECIQWLRDNQKESVR